MKIKSKAKATIALMASLLVGITVSSTLRLVKDVHAEENGVSFKAVDSEHPTDTVSSFFGVDIINSNGEIYNRADQPVQDNKFDLSKKPTTDPSGGALCRDWQESYELYNGYGNGTNDISGYSDSYYWDGSSWIAGCPDPLSQPSSTGFWYAEKQTKESYDLVTGAATTEYYWTVQVRREMYSTATSVYTLPAGDYTLLLKDVPGSYTDENGVSYSDYSSSFKYQFEQEQVSFTVTEGSPTTVNIPIKRINLATVTIDTKDSTHPSDDVENCSYTLIDENGDIIDYARTGSANVIRVPDSKLDISNIPTVDPSGYSLQLSTSSENTYIGREYSNSLRFDDYYWNGTTWQKEKIYSSTGYWEAIIATIGRTNETTGEWEEYSYWKVRQNKNDTKYDSMKKIPAGNYTLVVTSLPSGYYDEAGNWHSPSNADKFRYEAEQTEVSFTVTDQDTTVVFPVRRIQFHQVNFVFKDVDNPAYSFGSPHYYAFNEAGDLYTGSGWGNFTTDLKLDVENVPSVDPVGGSLTEESFNSYGKQAYRGTVYDSDPGVSGYYYWNGTTWQKEKIYSSTGYWMADVSDGEYYDSEQGTWVTGKWRWCITYYDDSEYSPAYLKAGNYTLALSTADRTPTYYYDAEGNYHDGSSENFSYEYVKQSGIAFTVTDTDESSQTVEVPIKKVQKYTVTVKPTDALDPTCTPDNSFYYQLFNEAGQIYAFGRGFQDDQKIDSSNMPTTDPVGGELKFEGVTSYGRKIYKGTSYDSEPDVHAYYSWNGSEWRKYGLPSSTGYWYAYLQSEYHTDESTGQWVAYKWHWAVTVDAAKEQSGDTFSLPAGNYTLRILTVPRGYQDAEGNWHGDGNEGYYKAEQSEVSFTVEDSDITVDVPFVRHERYKTYADMKDSKSSDYTYGDNISGYIKNEEGKYYYFFGDLPNGFYEDTGVDYGTPTTDPDGGELTYQYSETYYGPLFAEPQNGGTYYWNGSAWIDEPLFSLKGTWVATYVQTNGSYCWKVKNATSDALVSLGNGNYTWLESGTYTFVPVVYPTYMYQNGNSTWIDRDDVKAIEPVTFTVNGAETAFDVIIERIPSRVISLSLVDKDDTAYKVYIKRIATDSAIYRVKNLDTGKYLDHNGEERDLIVASKANIPAVDPVGGSTKIKENSTFDGLPVYTGTEYTSDPQIWTTYYWTGSEWATSSGDFFNGAWTASINSESRYDSEQETWVTDKWYWEVKWDNHARGCMIGLGASSSPLITIKGTGNFQIEELVPPSCYISPDGVTVTGSVYKKINPVQLTITDDSPDEINITLEYERIPLSEKMPEAGERASMLLTLTGCLAMIALAFTATRSRRKKVVG